MTKGLKYNFNHGVLDLNKKHVLNTGVLYSIQKRYRSFGERMYIIKKGKL